MAKERFELNKNLLYKWGILQNHVLKVGELTDFVVDNVEKRTLKPYEIVDLINQLSRENEDLKLNIQTALQEEYDERSREMDHWASEEDWNGYGATQLERGTVLRIARKLGIKLDER